MAIQLLRSVPSGHLTAVRSAMPLPRLAVSDWNRSVDCFVSFFSLCFLLHATTLLSTLEAHA